MNGGELGSYKSLKTLLLDGTYYDGVCVLALLAESLNMYVFCGRRVGGKIYRPSSNALFIKN